MSNTLSVRVTSRKNDTGEFYEGTVNIAGLKPTKLARRSDGSTQFPTKSAVSGAARNLAKALGFADVEVVDASKTAVAAAGLKKAAKKSAVEKTEKPAAVKATKTKSKSTATTTTPTTQS